MADRTESSIRIDASPEDVLAVIADFEAYPDWTGSVKEVEVVAADENGWAEQVRYVLDAGVVKDTYTLEYTWDVAEDGTGTVSWQLVEATVLKALDGAYDLRDAGGACDVTYRLSVDLSVPMLGMLRRKAEKVIIDTALNELKKRAEG